MLYDRYGMKKGDLAKRMARERHISQGKAADTVDKVVHKILRNLRSGGTASIPGLGTLTPGPKPQFHVEPGKGSEKKDG